MFDLKVRQIRLWLILGVVALGLAGVIASDAAYVISKRIQYQKSQTPHLYAIDVAGFDLDSNECPNLELVDLQLGSFNVGLPSRMALREVGEGAYFWLGPSEEALLVTLARHKASARTSEGIEFRPAKTNVLDNNQTFLVEAHSSKFDNNYTLLSRALAASPRDYSIRKSKGENRLVTALLENKDYYFPRGELQISEFANASGVKGFVLGAPPDSKESTVLMFASDNSMLVVTARGFNGHLVRCIVKWVKHA